MSDVPNKKRFIYKHVIILGIDGAGNFRRKCHMPNTDAIFVKNGAWTDHCRAAYPSISAQCWASMLIGVKPCVHRLTNDKVGEYQYPYTDTENPTIFSLVRKAHPTAKLGSFCNWSPISRGIVERDIGVVTAEGDDEVITQKVCEYIKGEKPELLFVQFDSVDHFGHHYGYGSSEYLNLLELIDGYIGMIYDAIAEAGILDDTLFIVTSDHGGILTSHGGGTDEEMNNFFGVHGASVNKAVELSAVLGRDLPAIVCYALDVPGSPRWDSFIPQNLFCDNMTPEKRAEEPREVHISRQTPEEGSVGALSNFVDMDSLRVGLFFDEGLRDIVGKEQICSIGKVYYTDGYFGKCIRVSSEGYLSIPSIRFGTDGFTVCMWLKVDEGVPEDPCIFSNKDRENRKNDGFAYYYKNGRSEFNVGHEQWLRNNYEYEYGQPEDFTVWNHIAIAVDRKNQQVVFYSNFEKASCDELRPEFAGVSFDSGLPLNFGQDGTGKYPFPLTAQIDDLLIFDKALSPSDVKRLGEYYRA